MIGSKTNQSLKEAPMSVTVLDSATLDRAGVTNIRDIDDLAPNVSISQLGQTGGSYITIRGIESNPFIVNRAAVYVDGIPYREADDLKLRNAKQVEILRGPQSALYGANANAGVIVITTRTPKEELSGEIEAGYSAFEGRGIYNIGGFISGGLAPGLTGLINIDYENGDSFVRNIASSIGEKGELAELNVSSKLRYAFGDSGQLEFTGFYNELDAPGLYEQEFPALDFDGYNSLYGASFNNGLKVGEFEFANDAPKLTNDKEWGFGATFGQSLGAFQIDAIAAYRNVEEESFGTDLDLTGTAFTAGGGEGENKMWHAEVRLSNDADSIFDWLIGTSYYKQDRVRTLSTLIGPGGLDDYVRAPEQGASAEDIAVFGQVIVPIIDRLKLTGGLRYEHASGKIDQDEGLLNLGPFLSFSFPRVDESFENDIWLPKLSLSYQLTSAWQTYATAAKGYLPGGYNLVAAGQGDAVSEEFGQYEPEELWSYEVGGKGVLLDGAAFLSGAIFFVDASSWQEVSVLTAPDGSVLSTALISSNASLESKGFEVEIALDPTDNLELSFGLGYTDAEYKTYKFSEDKEFSGNKVKLVPEFDLSLGATYHFNERWYIRSDTRAIGETPLNAENTAIRDTTWLFDASVGYQTDDWSIRAFVENATEERYAAGQAYQNFLFGDDGLFYAPLAQPRSIGHEVSKKFNP
ncbi:MAG: TonB-dependent receptor [Pseudomonadota bacterium]